jgi:hypothetical protein
MPRYVDAALKRGDWRVVELLNTRHFHPGSGPLRLLEGVGDHDTQYKMTKLLRLGASGSYAKSLDGELHDMKHPDRRRHYDRCVAADRQRTSTQGTLRPLLRTAAQPRAAPACHRARL